MLLEVSTFIFFNLLSVMLFTYLFKFFISFFYDLYRYLIGTIEHSFLFCFQVWFYRFHSIMKIIIVN